jgi:hypothetical protein
MNIKRVFRIGTLVVGLAALAGVGLLVVQAQVAATLYLQPGSPVVDPGDVFTISMQVSDAGETTGWQAGLTYDPTVITPTGTYTMGAFLVPTDPQHPIPLASFEEGQCTFAMAQQCYQMDCDTVSQGGELVEIEFEALANGTSPLGVVEAVLVAPGGEEQSLATADGSVQVGDLTPTNTPQPTATDTPAPTATDTPEPTATDTPEPTATDTPEPTTTGTPAPTATDTPEPTATDTPEPTATDTPEPTATDTPEPTATNTPQPTPTDTPEGNLLENSGFEAGDSSGWIAEIGEEFDVSSGTGRTGQYGGWHSGGWIANDAAVVPGDTYQMSIWARLDEVVEEPSWGGYQLCAVSIHDDWSWDWLQCETIASSSDWTRAEMIVRPTTDWLRLLLRHHHGGVLEVSVDDAYLAGVTVEPIYLPILLSGP